MTSLEDGAEIDYLRHILKDTAHKLEFHTRFATPDGPCPVCSDAIAEIRKALAYPEEP